MIIILSCLLTLAHVRAELDELYRVESWSDWKVTSIFLQEGELDQMISSTKSCELKDGECARYLDCSTYEFDTPNTTCYQRSKGPSLYQCVHKTTCQLRLCQWSKKSEPLFHVGIILPHHYIALHSRNSKTLLEGADHLPIVGGTMMSKTGIKSMEEIMIPSSDTIASSGANIGMIVGLVLLFACIAAAVGFVAYRYSDKIKHATQTIQHRVRPNPVVRLHDRDADTMSVQIEQN